MPTHESFSLAEWCSRYPLDAYLETLEKPDDYDQYLRSFICGPRSLAIDIQIRNRLWPTIDDEKGHPTDVFAWAWGESSNVAQTRIGGVPFLPTRYDWPMDGKERPMHFIAQFNFSDSLDLVPALPGDVLLIFVPQYYFDVDDIDPDDPTETIYLEVENAHFLFAHSDSDAVYSAAEMPSTNSQLWPLHGQILRSTDRPDVYDEYVAPHNSQVGGMFVDPPAVLCASKIGGCPTWVQEEPDNESLNGSETFLCQLISDRSDLFNCNPYSGYPAPFSEDFESRNKTLVIADMGTMYIYWNGDNIVIEIQGC